jgi:hypothetical protein
MCLNRLGKLEIPILPAQPGTPGLNGNNGNVWLSGVGEPTAQLGSLDDYYLDTVTNIVWHKTSSTTWEQIADLTGPEGQEGPVSQAPSTVPGPQGEAGATVIFNYDGTSNTTAGYVSLLAFGPTITAGTIDLYDLAVFDIGVQHYYQNTGLPSTTNNCDIKLLLNSVSITPNPILGSENSTQASLNQTASGKLRVTINRRSATSAFVTVEYSDINGKSISYIANDLTIDFNANIFPNVEGKIRFTSGASFVKCKYITLTIFKS